jgi:hypothetical protein
MKTKCSENTLRLKKEYKKTSPVGGCKVYCVFKTAVNLY